MSPARVFARPAPHSVWLGPGQQTALSRLLVQAPLKWLSGPCSSGKTVLLAHAGARLAADAVVLRCDGPCTDARAMLSRLLREAELGPWTLGETDQRNLLAVFIEQRRLAGQRVVITIDDVEHLGREAWEELDRLRRFSLAGSPAVELLLAAREAEAPADSAGLASSWIDAAPVITLPPASHADVADYVDWRCRRLGLTNPFRPLAMRLIARLSDGRYGAVDTLCQMTMILMRQRGDAQASVRLVQQALAALAARRKARPGVQPLGATAEAVPRR